MAIIIDVNNVCYLFSRQILKITIFVVNLDSTSDGASPVIAAEILETLLQEDLKYLSQNSENGALIL
jgi:hypothetical protein